MQGESDLMKALGRAKQAQPNCDRSAIQPKIDHLTAEMNGPAGKKRPWGEWGGFDGEFGGNLGATALTLFVPVVPFLLHKACEDYGCAVSIPIRNIVSGDFSWADLWSAIPATTPVAWAAFLIYLAFQVVLWWLLPGEKVKGLPTPTGNVLTYKINGLCPCPVEVCNYIELR